MMNLGENYVMLISLIIQLENWYNSWRWRKQIPTKACN